MSNLLKQSLYQFNLFKSLAEKGKPKKTSKRTTTQLRKSAIKYIKVNLLACSYHCNLRTSHIFSYYRDSMEFLNCLTEKEKQESLLRSLRTYRKWITSATLVTGLASGKKLCGAATPAIVPEFIPIDTNKSPTIEYHVKRQLPLKDCDRLQLTRGWISITVRGTVPVEQFVRCYWDHYYTNGTRGSKGGK